MTGEDVFWTLIGATGLWACFMVYMLIDTLKHHLDFHIEDKD